MSECAFVCLPACLAACSSTMNSSTALTLLKGAAASALAWRALSSLSAPVPKLMRKKCVVLTGAANGVGKLTALLLAQRGAHLVLWDIQEDALADAVHWIREAVPQAQVVSFVCDLSSRAQIYEAAKRTKAECRSRCAKRVQVGGTFVTLDLFVLEPGKTSSHHVVLALNV